MSRTIEELAIDEQVGGSGEHVCAGIVTSPDFPDLAPDLIRELSVEHDLELDGSLQSLDEIERVIRDRFHLFHEGPDEWARIERKVFPGLLAYVGSIVREQTNGRWSFRKVENGVYEPSIVGSDGRHHDLTSLLSMFYKEEELFSLRGETQIIIDLADSHR